MAKKLGSSEFYANSLGMFQTEAQTAIIGHIINLRFLSDIILRFLRMLYIFFFFTKKILNFAL